VRVDEARSSDAATQVDLFFSMGGGQVTDARDTVAADADVARVAQCARAVHDAGVADQKVEFFLHFKVPDKNIP
jgi:hypothetical protein